MRLRHLPIDNPQWPSSYLRWLCQHEWGRLGKTWVPAFWKHFYPQWALLQNKMICWSHVIPFVHSLANYAVNNVGTNVEYPSKFLDSPVEMEKVGLFFWNHLFRSCMMSMSSPCKRWRVSSSLKWSTGLPRIPRFFFFSFLISNVNIFFVCPLPSLDLS